MQAETIFALSSGALAAALLSFVSPVLRFHRCSSFLWRSRSSRARRLSARFRDPRDGSELDRGLILHFPAPNSFTGEDVLEFQVHGSLAIMRHLLSRLGDVPGLRPALPGEFTRRAWLGGRMNLLEVEALSDTLAAETELQRKLALEGSRWLRLKAQEWRAALLSLRALVEASIDFSDEGDVIDRLDSVPEREILSLADSFRTAAGTLNRGQSLRRGFRVAILGAPNAGKSSLMNALADRDVAITSPIPWHDA